LKAALKAALSRTDDYSGQVVTSSRTLQLETKRRKAVEEELNAVTAENSELHRHLTEAREQLRDRAGEVQRLEREARKEDYIATIETLNRSLKTEITELMKEQEESDRFTAEVRSHVEECSSFISRGLHDLPDYFAMFKGRFRGKEELVSLDGTDNLLKVLQFLRDLLIFEAKRRMKDTRLLVSQDVDLPIEQLHSTPAKSLDKSMQTVFEKGTSTGEVMYRRVTPPALSVVRPKSRVLDFNRETSLLTAYRPYGSPLMSSSMRRDTSLEGGLNSSDLIGALSVQSDKLSQLNQQITETMTSSRNLLNSSLAHEGRIRPAVKDSILESVSFDVDEIGRLEQRMLSKTRSERELTIPTQLDLKVIVGEFQSSLKAPNTEKSASSKRFGFKMPRVKEQRQEQSQEQSTGVKSDTKPASKFKTMAALSRYSSSTGKK
jgi:hypothetical protein